MTSIEDEIEDNRKALLQRIKEEIEFPECYEFEVADHWYIDIGERKKAGSHYLIIQGIHIMVRTSIIYNRVFFIKDNYAKKGYSYKSMDSAIERIKKIAEQHKTAVRI